MLDVVQRVFFLSQICKVMLKKKQNLRWCPSIKVLANQDVKFHSICQWNSLQSKETRSPTLLKSGATPCEHLATMSTTCMSVKNVLEYQLHCQCKLQVIAIFVQQLTTCMHRAQKRLNYYYFDILRLFTIRGVLPSRPLAHVAAGWRATDYKCCLGSETLWPRFGWLVCPLVTTGLPQRSFTGLKVVMTHCHSKWFPRSKKPFNAFDLYKYGPRNEVGMARQIRQRHASGATKFKDLSFLWILLRPCMPRMVFLASKARPVNWLYKKMSSNHSLALGVRNSSKFRARVSLHSAKALANDSRISPIWAHASYTHRSSSETMKLLIQNSIWGQNDPECIPPGFESEQVWTRRAFKAFICLGSSGRCFEPKRSHKDMASALRNEKPGA